MMTLLGILAGAAEAVVEGDVEEFSRLQGLLPTLMIGRDELTQMEQVMGVMSDAIYA